MLPEKMLESRAMRRRTLLQTISTIPLLPLASLAALPEKNAEAGPADTTVYELRVYHAYEGKLEDLLKRFREHTTKLFEKHGMKNVAYWLPQDEPLKGKTKTATSASPHCILSRKNCQPRSFGDPHRMSSGRHRLLRVSGISVWRRTRGGW